MQRFKTNNSCFVLVNVNEEAGTTNQMVAFYNLRIMRICGFEFVGGSRGVNLSLVGGLCRHIGKFDIARFYGPKMRS